MNRIVLIVWSVVALAISACNTPSVSTDDGRDGIVTGRSIPAASNMRPMPYVTRKRPIGTFDLLSPIVAPGGQVTQVVTLEDGWKVSGEPRLVDDPDTKKPSTFHIENATTMGPIYTVVATNTGSVPARLVADVPFVVISH